MPIGSLAVGVFFCHALLHVPCAEGIYYHTFDYYTLHSPTGGEAHPPNIRYWPYFFLGIFCQLCRLPSMLLVR